MTKAALAILMAATCCEAAPLQIGESEPKWDEYKNLLDTDASGSIDIGKYGDERRGRSSEFKWMRDFFEYGWLGAVDFSKNEQYILAQSIWRDLGGTTGDLCGITLDQYHTVYGTNNVDFDTEVFEWANG